VEDPTLKMQSGRRRILRLRLQTANWVLQHMLKPHGLSRRDIAHRLSRHVLCMEFHVFSRTDMVNTLDDCDILVKAILVLGDLIIVHIQYFRK